MSKKEEPKKKAPDLDLTFTDEEWALMRKAAKRTGKTLGDWVAKTLVGAIDKMAKKD